MHTWPSAEAQIAALSDDIAYNNHDIDDALRANLITLDDLRELPMTGDILRDIDKQHGDIDPRLIRHELVREMISLMIGDLVTVVRSRLEENRIETADDVREMGSALGGVFAGNGSQAPNHQKFPVSAGLSASQG